MDTTALVALAVAVTQLGKSWLQSWFKGLEWKSWMSVVLSFLVSIGVVFYTAIKTQVPITLELAWVIVSVFALANGAKKLINVVKPANPT